MANEPHRLTGPHRTAPAGGTPRRTLTRPNFADHLDQAARRRPVVAASGLASLTRVQVLGLRAPRRGRRQGGTAAPRTRGSRRPRIASMSSASSSGDPPGEPRPGTGPNRETQPGAALDQQQATTRKRGRRGGRRRGKRSTTLRRSRP